jgi:protein-disulfide isomerase
VRKSNKLAGVLVGIFIVGLGTVAAQEQDNNQEVVAIVNGKKITMADVEQKKAANLLQARDQYYHAQRKAVEMFMDDYLLEEQAKKENLTVEQLLDRHVNSTVKEPTEDQIEVFYEGTQSDQPFSAMRQKIVDTIHDLRVSKARTEYLSSLRSQASLQVLLAPPTAEVARDDAPTRGPGNATVSVIEFADYECPYCKKIHPDLKKLQEEFPDKVSLAFKDFPLPAHKHAEKAAEAARCAGRQGKYWEYHDALFENSGLEVAQLKATARTLKLDGTSFDNCLDSSAEAPEVKKDQAQGQKLGLAGTPSFFINGHFVSGAASYATLREMVEQQLASSSTSPQIETARN